MKMFIFSVILLNFGNWKKQDFLLSNESVLKKIDIDTLSGPKIKNKQITYFSKYEEINNK
jgi:hypothetical protein